MDYDLTKPCAKCPFRTDCLKGWLGRARATEIVNSNGEFACHETTAPDDDEGGDLVVTEGSKHCAGFLILLEKMERPNQMMRICERIGMYDHRKLKMDSPVFDTAAEFVDHHGAKKRKVVKRGR